MGRVGGHGALAPSLSCYVSPGKALSHNTGGVFPGGRVPWELSRLRVTRGAAGRWPQAQPAGASTVPTATRRLCLSGTTLDQKSPPCQVPPSLDHPHPATVRWVSEALSPRRPARLAAAQAPAPHSLRPCPQHTPDPSAHNSAFPSLPENAPSNRKPTSYPVVPQPGVGEGPGAASHTGWRWGILGA